MLFDVFDKECSSVYVGTGNPKSTQAFCKCSDSMKKPKRSLGRFGFAYSAVLVCNDLENFFLATQLRRGSILISYISFMTAFFPSV